MASDWLTGSEWVGKSKWQQSAAVSHVDCYLQVIAIWVFRVCFELPSRSLIQIINLMIRLAPNIMLQVQQSDELHRNSRLPMTLVPESNQFQHRCSWGGVPSFPNSSFTIPNSVESALTNQLQHLPNMMYKMCIGVGCEREEWRNHLSYTVAGTSWLFPIG